MMAIVGAPSYGSSQNSFTTNAAFGQQPHIGQVCLCSSIWPWFAALKILLFYTFCVYSFNSLDWLYLQVWAPHQLPLAVSSHQLLWHSLVLLPIQNNVSLLVQLQKSAIHLDWLMKMCFSKQGMLHLSYHRVNADYQWPEKFYFPQCL